MPVLAVSISTDNSTTNYAVPISDKVQDTIELDNLVLDDPAGSTDDVFKKDNMWMDIHGTWVHKSSAVCLMLADPAGGGLKST